MNAISNFGFLNLFAVTTLNGFTPAVGYVYNAGAKTIAITDSSTYAAGDGLKIVHIHITDAMGGVLYNKVTVTGGGGAVTIDTSTLNPLAGYNITCTVVTNNGALGDLSAYGVGATSPATGSLSYPNKQLA